MTTHKIDTPKRILPLSDGTYNFLVKVAQYYLPALATLYVALAIQWGFPNVEQIVGTITAIDIFLGILLGVSKNSYNKSDAKYDGALVLSAGEEGTILERLEVDTDLAELQDKGTIVLKFKDPSQ